MSKHMGAVALGLALVVHAVALYLPGSPDPGLSAAVFPQADKVVHVLLFAVPAFLVRRLTARWWPIALLALHAPVSELVQYGLVPYRSGDPWDLVADLAGIGLGVWLGQRMRSGAVLRGRAADAGATSGQRSPHPRDRQGQRSSSP